MKARPDRQRDELPKPLEMKKLGWKPMSKSSRGEAYHGLRLGKFGKVGVCLEVNGVGSVPQKGGV